MAKKENIPKKSKKKDTLRPRAQGREEESKNMTTIILIVVGLLIIIASIYYFVSIGGKEKTTPTNQSLGNYTIPTTNIEQKDFVCPTKKYLNCVPPILPSDNFCMNPYRQWITENCPDVQIFE